MIEVKSPNSGVVCNMKIKVGDKIEEGMELLSVESDKCNTPVNSEHCGIVESLNVKEGEKVTEDQVLIKINQIEKGNQGDNIIAVHSPISGIVGNLEVKIGDKVDAGQELLSLEDNKECTIIKADHAGVIDSINIRANDQVNEKDLLLKILPFDKNIQAATVKNNKSKETIKSDITVIGGGPGGYVAAIKAAKMGASVVLIEKDTLGGTCLNRGCIPTKALVRSAEVYDELKDAEAYGLSIGEAYVNMDKVIERKNSIVKKLTSGVSCLIRKNNIRLIAGSGKLVNKNTVLAETADKSIEIECKNIILATGSEAVYLPIPGADSNNVLTSTEILDLKTLPSKLAIIGGGVIGMEFAFIFASFGVEVFVVEYLDNVLQMLDQDVIDEIKTAAKKKGIKLYTSSRVEEILDTEDNNSILRFTKDGVAKYISVDKVLMSVGRKPYLDGLDIEAAGVELNDNKKGIKVNDKMQTNIENIYAIGDLTNIMQLAHVASHQGIIAVENIMGQDKDMDYSAIPSAIFTHPEIATVGLTEKEAKSKGMNIEVGKFPYAANGKALAMGDGRGFIKVIKDNNSKRIVGAAIIGINSADLISSLTIAIRNGLTTEQIVETVFAHPTTAEVIHEASLSVEGGAIHFAG